MFSKEFELILIVGLAVITVMLFMGKGDMFLKSRKEQRKKTPEEKLKFGRVVGCFTGFLMVAELVLFFFGTQQWVTIAYLIAVAAALAGLIFYCNKNA